MKSQLLIGDVKEMLPTLAAESVQMCVTSPPYWGLRDYGVEGQLGLEKTPEEYVASMVEVFREVRRVLKPDGTLWLNLGDSYSSGNRASYDAAADNLGQKGILAGKQRPDMPANLKPKDLIGIPWRVAFALQADGWYLRSEIIWHKVNALPESVRDRPSKAHEQLFLLSKKPIYYYDAAAIAEKRQWGGQERTVFDNACQGGATPPGTGNHSVSLREFGTSKNNPGLRNRRSVWSISSHPFTDRQQTSRWVRVEQGEVSDDNLRIVSPDCPVYGGLFDLLATVLDDGHGYDQLIDIACKRGHLSLIPKDGYVPIGQLRALRIGDDSLDFFLGAYLLTAIDHSKQRSKKGLFVATSLACKPSAQRLDHIERILARHELSVLRPDKPGNNTWESGFSDSQKPRTIYCIAGSLESREFCEAQGLSFSLNKESISHFAAFPPKLIEPCIAAGSRPGDTVLDPFIGSGTTGEVCERLGRHWVGIEINPEYGEMAKWRTAQRGLAL